MATFYFNAAVDSEWATLGNWWLDEACTIPAPELPSSATDVVVTATIYDATYTTREVRSLEVLGPDIKAGLERLFVSPVRS